MSPSEEIKATRGGLTRAGDVTTDNQPWGHLEWMVSGEAGNSDRLTVGKCFIRPGEQNPPHYHPNCDEVLHVINGTITHRVEEDYVEMGPGDTISIPTGSVHNARNTGEVEAELLICFSTAYREVVGE